MASAAQPDILALHAQNRPTKMALICDGRSVTFNTSPEGLFLAAPTGSRTL